MKLLLTILTVIIWNFSVAQDTKKRSVSNDYPSYKETFYVLKSDPEIKHGEYAKKYGGLSVKGQFENNKKVGVWEYYDRSGQLEQKIDFTTNKLIFTKPFDLSSKFWVKEGTSLKEVQPDEIPIFMGGKSGVIYYVWNLRYPADARRYGIQGKVIVSVTVTKDGKIVDEKVEEGLGYGLDEEALRVIEMIPDEWIPGKVNGEYVDMKILLPVTFKLG